MAKKDDKPVHSRYRDGDFAALADAIINGPKPRRRFRTEKARVAWEEKRAARFKPGDRVTVEHEGTGTVVDCDAFQVGVRIDRDGVTVSAAHEQTKEDK